MLDRKLLVEALRIDNKDVLPKFGSPELKKVMEAATEYVNINNILDYEEGKVTREGAFDLMDLLERGSVGISDSDNQPALNFILSGSDIYAHNMFTDEDDVLDATPEALAEYIEDQLETRTFDAEDYESEEDYLKTEEAAFQNIKEFRTALEEKKAKLQEKLDQGISYKNFGQDEIKQLRDKMPVVGEGDDLLKMQKELDNFNKWCLAVTPKKYSFNEHVDSDDLDSATNEIKRKLNYAADSIKRTLETIEGIRIGGLDFNSLQHIVDRVEEVSDDLVDEIYDMFTEEE